MSSLASGSIGPLWQLQINWPVGGVAAGIHNRMPVIFDRLQGKQWLDPRLSTREADITAVFAPFPSHQMQAHDFSPLVNKPEYDNAECINPASDPQSRLL